jgi:hypothetical protein
MVFSNNELDISHWRRLFDGILVGLSDTQIITALALTIVTEFLTSCKVSAYHYNVVCELVLMSTMVHICSMTTIEHYFYNKLLASVRILFIIANFILGLLLFVRRAASDNFPTDIPSNKDKTNMTSLVIPAVCSMGNNTSTPLPNDSSNSHRGIVSYVLVFAFFIAAASLSMFHTHRFNNDKPFSAKKWTFWARGAMSVMALGVSILFMVHLNRLRVWMRSSGWFVVEDNGEYAWESFGQLVPMILLILPVLQFVESVASKIVTFPNIEFTDICSCP